MRFFANFPGFFYIKRAKRPKKTFVFFEHGVAYKKGTNAAVGCSLNAKIRRS